MISTNPEIAQEIEKAQYRLAKATAEYIVRLAAIADITTLTTGDHGFDYAVTVSHKDKLDLLPRLSDLTYDIETEFGVKITTLAVCGS
ncbi:MAG: hypothetical protein QOI11_1965 [Candidatus Eremiobacteraeota bacterium]|jgi:hypothetical protein|nr:hypothetical protein [Candidatus Eremiobacteraeota bacterium]